MKKIVLFMLAALAMTACNEQEKTFTVKGNIEGAADKTLYLQNKGLAGTTVIDSVKLDASGAFEFTEKAPETPEFYQLTLENQFINIAVDSTETITIYARQPNISGNYEVGGSQSCQKICELSTKQRELHNDVQSLLQHPRYNQQQIIDSINSLINIFKQDVTMNYIYEAPASTYAYYALFLTLGRQNIFDRTNPDDLRAFAAVATSWDTFHPGSERTEHLHNTALKGMTDNRIAAINNQFVIDEDKISNSGVLDLTLPDASGRTRTLTELDGKVVLLDFHAFAMDNSAERILALRDLYNKYHDKGFEIYQVSVDADEHLWKQASQSLPWVCVYDANGLSLLRYNVPSVPEFFLIDRSNTLYKRSSQMSDLEEEIKKLL